MKYLLDSHTLLWLLMDSGKLSNKARSIIDNPDNELYASTVSFWEISLKYGIGKLPIPDFEIEELGSALVESGIKIIGLNEQESLSYCRLPEYQGHRDPFDRMLIWQAIKRSMALLSSDEQITRYRDIGLNVVW